MAKTEPAEIRSQPLFADFEVLLRVSALQARVPFLAAVPPIQRHAYTVITFLTCESHECSWRERRAWSQHREQRFRSELEVPLVAVRAHNFARILSNQRSDICLTRT